MKSFVRQVRTPLFAAVLLLFAVAAVYLSNCGGGNGNTVSLQPDGGGLIESAETGALGDGDSTNIGGGGDIDSSNATGGDGGGDTSNTIIHAEYTVTVSGNGVGMTGGGRYAAGDTVAVTAGTPPAGYVFKNWTSVNSNVIFADASSPATTFLMPANAVTVTAVFEAFTFNYSIEMVSVEGGTFTMGCTNEQGSDCEEDESPTHSVTLSGYSIGKYEVTQGLWEAVMGSLPTSTSTFGRGADYPVYGVSWDDIVNNFIPKLNDLTGKTYRLPTEAEWEYAARGGVASRGYKYSGSDTINSWNDSNTAHTVGGKTPPNELGIYDMSGNVSEWVSDWYNDNYYSSSPLDNPTGSTLPESSSIRVVRGGSWAYAEKYCRVSDRGSGSLDNGHYSIGFRLALPTP